MISRAASAGKLAIENGFPVRVAPFPPWPSYSDEEIWTVRAVLGSGHVNYWTGRECISFEEEYAASTDRRYGIAVANGTVALELALRAIEIGPGDEVIVTPRSFFASASTVVQRGATPIFADVDPDSQNITAEGIRAAVTPRTRAVVVVHLAGWPCDMESICAAVSEHGLDLIEDCAQAHGARYQGRPVGSFGKVGVFSFCQDKIISTGGEGGLLVTDDENVWDRAWSFKDHGKSFALVHGDRESPGFRWLHHSIGSNYRMTEMQAAIGRIQLRSLNASVIARRNNAQQLSDCFSRLPLLRVTTPPEHIDHSYYKYYAFVRPERLASGWTRDRLIEAVAAEGVPVFSGSCPEIYLEKAFADLGYQPDRRLEVARELGETSLMFPVHPTLQATDIGDICEAVTKVATVAVR